MRLQALLPAAAAASLLATPAATQTTDPRSGRVDSLFAAVSGTASPGCAVGVIQNGRFLHRRGYGMADLERRVAITPGTVFYTGSVSKQFTAMGVALLARDGRIALDDPARRYLPEIPEAGAGITVRHMVHHLSGLREKWDLLMLSGFRESSLVTQDDVLALVKAQRALSFPPGDDHLYNNTAYDLLATLIARVAGSPLPAFAERRIFGPLGMTSSRYLDDQSLLVPDRALGYSIGPEGVRQAPAYVETVGSGSVYSTVDDLARWDESFYTAALGDAALLRLVQTPGRLNDGTTLTYAFGLMVDTWRGLRRVHHGGALAGYRSTIVRFPERHFSVIVLCNYAQAVPDRFAARIAEIYLEGQLAPADAPADRPAPGPFRDRALAARIEGLYRSPRSGMVLRIERRPDSTVALRYGPITAGLDAAGPSRVVVGPIPGVTDTPAIEFGGSPAVQRATLTGLGDRPDTFERVDPPAADAGALQAFAGRYRSPELGVTWELVVADGRLVARRPAGEDIPLEPLFRDGFRAGQANAVVARGAGGRIEALVLSTARSRGIRFERER